MEAPGQLSDKEDSMPSTTLRAVAAAVVLSLLLGFCAAPATAQPRGLSSPAERAETGTLARLWLWVHDLWTSGGPLERTPSLSGLSAPSTTETTINRGGTFDPNGHS
jgi:hypothetical protein